MMLKFRGLIQIFGSICVLIIAILTYIDIIPFYHDVFIGVLFSFVTVNQILLGVYGANSFYLLYKSISIPDSPNEADISLDNFIQRKIPWPYVTVQLPIYNEKYVIQRLLQSAVRIDYPSELLEIQVLDDSTDETREQVRCLVNELNSKYKFNIVHLTRNTRYHYKAGALAMATKQANGEFMAIFDSDFVIPSDFLRKTIPRFYEDKMIGCVQCRWGHLNFDHSYLTKLQAIGHDGHFIIEQHAKSKSRFPLNFNGTAGVWRKDAIEHAGGWSGETLAEDLDLSYRAQLVGYRIDYLREVVVKAEVPLTISAFKKQQARWAKGSIQTAMKMVPRVWDSNILDWWQKVQGTIHLLGYAVHLLMLFNLITTICLFFMTDNIELNGPDYVFYIACFMAIGPPTIVAMGQLHLGQHKNMILMLGLVVMYHGLCLSNAAAVIEAIKGQKTSFERTPKFGSLGFKGGAWGKASYARALDAVGMPYGEVMMATILFIVMMIGTQVTVNKNTYPWLVFFFLSFTSVAILHLHERYEVKRTSRLTTKATTTTTTTDENDDANGKEKHGDDNDNNDQDKQNGIIKKKAA